MIYDRVYNAINHVTSVYLLVYDPCLLDYHPCPMERHVGYCGGAFPY